MTTSSPVDRALRLLRQCMEERKLREEDLARGLGCSVAEVRERLSGARLLGLDWLDAALAALEVSPAEFFARLYRAPAEGGGGEEMGSGRRDRAEPVRGGDPGDEPPGSEDPPPAEPVEEVLSREEVEALISEARALIRGSSRMIEARQKADGQQADDPRTTDEQATEGGNDAPPDASSV